MPDFFIKGKHAKCVKYVYEPSSCPDISTRKKLRKNGPQRCLLIRSQASVAKSFHLLQRNQHYEALRFSATFYYWGGLKLYVLRESLLPVRPPRSCHLIDRFLLKQFGFRAALEHEPSRLTWLLILACAIANTF